MGRNLFRSPERKQLKRIIRSTEGCLLSQGQTGRPVVQARHALPVLFLLVLQVQKDIWSNSKREGKGAYSYAPALDFKERSGESNELFHEARTTGTAESRI